MSFLYEIAPDVVGVDSAYTYSASPELNLQPGDGVLIPFGAQSVVGFVLRQTNVVPDATLKSVFAKIDEVSLPAELMKTLEFVATKYLCPFGAAIAPAVPPGIRSRLQTWYSGEEFDVPISELIAIRQGITKVELRKKVKSGVISRFAKLPEKKSARAKLLTLAGDEIIESYLANFEKSRSAQTACLICLHAAAPFVLSSAEIRTVTGASDATVLKLIEQGLLVSVSQKVRAGSNLARLELTAEQQRAFSEIEIAISSQLSRRFLLQGITGSGKTEVYMRAIEKSLQIGRSCLYVVPEISLTVQVVAQLKLRFGDKVAILHSLMTDSERLANWIRARNGEATIVLGARSCIFAPLPNIGLIVVDEEHDSSYKQENTPRYHVRDVAEFRAKTSNATLLLGSATPSIETRYRAELGELDLLKLNERATRAQLPSVTVVDLREGFSSLIGAELKGAIETALKNGEQALLFVNRRAYSNALVCRECGKSPRCPSCSVTLTFHRGKKILKCHHCGFSERSPDICPNCESSKLRPLGIGTEKVEEVVREEFPGVQVARLDRDIAQIKGRLYETLNEFRSGKTQILVGTQIIAKGLDFPKLSVVGVVAADTGLNMPDFRSSERVFQLLTQVSGRAGRHAPGRVIVQTFQPDAIAIKLAANHDYEKFFEMEIKDRSEALYPPFIRLVNIIGAHEDRLLLAKCMETLEAIYADRGLSVIGPADCPFERLHGKFRMHLLLRIGLEANPVLAALPEGIPPTWKALLRVDVDPLNLM